MAKATETKSDVLVITPPKFDTVTFIVTGTAPLMQARFSQKSMLKMKETQEAGQKAKSKKVREPRDFKADFEAAMHKSEEGWVGVPAAAFRNACIDACRAAGFVMTKAKMSIFVEADGLDSVDGQPLIKLDAGKPEQTELAVRNSTGVVDIRSRPMWRKWKLRLRIRFDTDQFSKGDIANLIERAGVQVGIGEGRPYSKQSNGLGYGTFTILDSKEAS